MHENAKTDNIPNEKMYLPAFSGMELGYAMRRNGPLQPRKAALHTARRAQHWSDGPQNFTSLKSFPSSYD